MQTAESQAVAVGDRVVCINHHTDPDLPVHKMRGLTQGRVYTVEEITHDNRLGVRGDDSHHYRLYKRRFLKIDNAKTD